MRDYQYNHLTMASTLAMCDHIIALCESRARVESLSAEYDARLRAILAAHAARTTNKGASK